MSSGGGPWWEFDPDERPVPLEGAAGAVAEVAEEIVEAHRQSIIREDTEPTLQTLLSMRGPAGRDVSESRTDRPVLRVGIALLIAGCVGAFSLGWSQGAATKTNRLDAVTETTVRQQSVESDEGSSTRTESRSAEEVSER
jgi:hypothetical protein